MGRVGQGRLLLSPRAPVEPLLPPCSLSERPQSSVFLARAHYSHLVGTFLSCTERAFSLSALLRRPRGSRYCTARPMFSPFVLKERLEGTRVNRLP